MGAKRLRSSNDLFMFSEPQTTLNLMTRGSRDAVSPPHDKLKESVHHSHHTLSTSIYSSKAPTKKQGIQVPEEPSSPKVTCLGQVRSKTKYLKKKMASPDPASYQNDMHKDSSRFVEDFVCLGIPCHSYSNLPLFQDDKKSSDTIIGKSLLLMQLDDEEKVIIPSAPRHPLPLEEIKMVGEPSTTKEDRKAERIMFKIGLLVQHRKTDESEAPQNTEILDDQTGIVEDDTYEVDPPLSNALLHMQSRSEHFPLIVPHPLVDTSVKQRTSATAHHRRKKNHGEYGSELLALGQNEVEYEQATHKFSVMKGTHYISCEDLPEPAKQPCKSVSQSLSVSGLIELAKGAKVSPAQADGRVLEDEYEHHHELHLASDALPRRRSDSDSLKVLPDMGPDTWILDGRVMPKEELDPNASTGSWRRGLDMKLIGGTAEWLDGDLETALWKSCHVAARESRSSICTGSLGPLEEAKLMVNQCLDAEVEASLWRGCNLVAPHSIDDLKSEPKSGNEQKEVPETANDMATTLSPSFAPCTLGLPLSLL